MKKYPLLCLALCVYTAQTTAMHRTARTAAKKTNFQQLASFTKRTAIGGATGWAAAMAIANECPIKRQDDGADNKVPAAALRAGVATGAMVASRIPGLAAAVVAIAIYDHQVHILKTIHSVQEELTSKKPKQK